jgi:hypothetical protein
MLYNILYTYEDTKDGKLILRCKIPDNVFAYIDQLNRYLSQFGRYRVDSFWLVQKEMRYDFKTTLAYEKYVEKYQ